jgi:hypothetical protein
MFAVALPQDRASPFLFYSFLHHGIGINASLDRKAGPTRQREFRGRALGIPKQILAAE